MVKKVLKFHFGVPGISRKMGCIRVWQVFYRKPSFKLPLPTQISRYWNNAGVRNPGFEFMTLPTSNQQRAVITIVQMNVSISYWKKALYLLIDKCPQIASNLASFSSMFLTVCCCSVKENRKYVLHYIFLGLVIDRKFKKKLYTNFVVNFLFESDASEIYKFNKQY